jgi:hypothetical protein
LRDDLGVPSTLIEQPFQPTDVARADHDRITDQQHRHEPEGRTVGDRTRVDRRNCVCVLWRRTDGRAARSGEESDGDYRRGRLQRARVQR